MYKHEIWILSKKIKLFNLQTLGILVLMSRNSSTDWKKKKKTHFKLQKLMRAWYLKNVWIDWYEI